MRIYVTVACLWISGFYLATSEATAQFITPVSQSRSLTLSWNTGSTTVSSPDFSPFVSTISTSANYESATAGQNSAINASSISASGSVGAYYQSGSSPISASSQLSVTFQITAPCLYSMTGSVYSTTPLGYGTGLALSGPTGTIFQALATGGGTLSYSTAGALQPGQYVISGSTTAAPNPVYEFPAGSFALSFQVSLPRFQVTSIAVQSSNVLLTWNGFAGTTNVVQATGGAADGSYSNNFLPISPPIIIPTGTVGVISTNYLDIGGATNTPSRFYNVAVLETQHMAVSPAVLDFGTVTTSTVSQQVFVVTNTSGVPIMNGQATATTGPFTIVSGSPFLLPPGGSSNVVVQFAPVTPGGVTGAVVFSDEYGYATTNSVTGAGNNCDFVPGTPSSLPWGIVTAGQTYSYEATGSIQVPRGCRTDPDGNVLSGTCTTGTASSSFICPGLVAYSLVGEINGQCVQLGSQGSFVAPTSGTLTLYFNNKTSGPNGSGGFNACINASPIAASFSAAPTNGVAPLVVTFTDNSTGAITNRFWDFGDGMTTNLSVAGTTHTYNSPGTDTASLIVSGPSGSDTNIQPNLIVAQ